MSAPLSCLLFSSPVPTSVSHSSVFCDEEGSYRPNCLSYNGGICFEVLSVFSFIGKLLRSDQFHDSISSKKLSKMPVPGFPWRK